MALDGIGKHLNSSINSRGQLVLGALLGDKDAQAENIAARKVKELRAKRGAIDETQQLAATLAEQVAAGGNAAGARRILRQATRGGDLRAQPFISAAGLSRGAQSQREAKSEERDAVLGQLLETQGLPAGAATLFNKEDASAGALAALSQRGQLEKETRVAKAEEKFQRQTERTKGRIGRRKERLVGKGKARRAERASERSFQKAVFESLQPQGLGGTTAPETPAEIRARARTAREITASFFRARTKSDKDTGTGSPEGTQRKQLGGDRSLAIPPSRFREFSVAVNLSKQFEADGLEPRMAALAAVAETVGDREAFALPEIEVKDGRVQDVERVAREIIARRRLAQQLKEIGASDEVSPEVWLQILADAGVPIEDGFIADKALARAIVLEDQKERNAGRTSQPNS